LIGDHDDNKAIICILFACISGIKKYIVGLIIKTSSDASLLEQEKVYVGKLNMILVQVLHSFLSLFFSNWSPKNKSL